MSIQTRLADPLFSSLPRAERPAYATGMLLDAQDFGDEQTYHRGRLARALAFLAGGGTLAGLPVSHAAAVTPQPEEIRVAGGLAVDRLGRLIELPRPACVRLARWYEATRAADDGATLRRAAYDNLARFVSPRLAASGATLPARAVVADVFIRFAACEVGLTPSFAAGPFDALNAVSTSRLRDAWELQLIAREGLDDSYSGLPLPPGGAAIAPLETDTATSLAARRDALQDAVLGAYAALARRSDGTEGLAPAPEHPPTLLDTSAIFLARVLIPVDAADPPQRTADAPLVDNGARRFLPALALLAQAGGL